MEFNLEENLCDDGCSWANDLGPPPDLIWTIPPPPLPHFLEEALKDIDQDNQSCNLCDWSTGADSVNFIELSAQGALAEDAWFFIILVLSVLLALSLALFTLICLRLRWRRVKSDDNEKSKQKVTDFYNPGVAGPIPVLPVGSTRALWAGLKHTEENHYTIAHVQPIEQKKTEPPGYDYGSVGYTSLTPDKGITFVNTAADTNDIHYMSTDVVRKPGIVNCAFAEDTAVSKLPSYPTGWRLIPESNSPRQPIMYETVVKPHQCVLVKRKESVKRGTVEKDAKKDSITPPIMLIHNNFPPLNTRVSLKEDEYAAPSSPVYAEPDAPSIRTLGQIIGRTLKTTEKPTPVLIQSLKGTMKNVPKSPIV
ncbi:uncharacterized protein LOC136030381 [Artemia franciscana]|uniref:Uncharacterized protein n=1 Tax=Artemia franciscana TaxID=6661 RepID=A0AA88KXX9_ARTSF|nr:hypothetical protein QYM36_016278 [Artemia franciscana]KAK2706184.1 hypothetical protein QYM36_016278 [Artemia franciscana]